MVEEEIREEQFYTCLAKWLDSVKIQLLNIFDDYQEWNNSPVWPNGPGHKIIIDLRSLTREASSLRLLFKYFNKNFNPIEELMTLLTNIKQNTHTDIANYDIVKFLKDYNSAIRAIEELRYTLPKRSHESQRDVPVTVEPQPAIMLIDSDNNHPDYMDYIDMSQRYSIPKEALRARLKRWEKDAKEHDRRFVIRPNDGDSNHRTKKVYRVQRVKGIIKEMQKK